VSLDRSHSSKKLGKKGTERGGQFLPYVGGFAVS
jgi:hypothetical protein